MAIKTRTELKSFFVKNAIPTEGNFADLIDSLFIQMQDGVYKSDTQPLSVTAAPGDQKRVLRLYKDYPQANPDWTVALMPVDGAATASGLGIMNSAGSTKLFIADNGRIGMGTIAPQYDLSVAGSVGVGGAIVPSVGNAENKGIQFPPDPGGGGGDRAFIRYFVETGENTKLLIGNNNDPGDRVSIMQTGAERLTVYDGKVGVNQVTPTHTLHVMGDAYVSGPLYFVPSTDPNYKLELFPWPGSGGIRVKGFGAVALTTSNGDVVTVTADRVGINNAAPGAALDITTRAGTWGGWLEGIRFSRPEHSAITHPGGHLLFGLHSDRNFYFADTNGAGRYLFQISAATANVTIPNGRLESNGGVLANAIGLGTQIHGATNYPYETIQMNPGHNLRVWYGTTERYVFSAAGMFSVTGAGGEVAYIGGDGAGNDVQIGSMTNGIQTIAAFSTIHGWMDLTCRHLNQTSDERLKENIEPVSDALDRVTRLRAVRFDWKDRKKTDAPPAHLGVIAQEVRTVVPEAISEGRDGSLAVSFEAMTALLIEAVKEQQKQLNELRVAINELRAPAKKGK